MQYRDVKAQELCPALFQHFVRRQVVTQCWRKECGAWVVKDAPFIDDWSAADYCTLVRCLTHTLATGGFVHAAFCHGQLKGFVSVESGLFGGAHAYLDLSSLHVSADARRQGVGAALFSAAKAWACRHGARKLYISAHSAVETQAFYRRMGCVEAAVYAPAHVEAEPFDCQLECAVAP